MNEKKDLVFKYDGENLTVGTDGKNISFHKDDVPSLEEGHRAKELVDYCLDNETLNEKLKDNDNAFVQLTNRFHDVELLIQETLNKYVGKQTRVALLLNESEKEFGTQIAVHGILESFKEGVYRVLSGKPTDRSVSYAYFKVEDIMTIADFEGVDKLSCGSQCVVYIQGKPVHKYDSLKPEDFTHLVVSTHKGVPNLIIR